MIARSCTKGHQTTEDSASIVQNNNAIVAHLAVGLDHHQLLPAQLVQLLACARLGLVPVLPRFVCLHIPVSNMRANPSNA
mgnify:CR=1 FL=1